MSKVKQEENLRLCPFDCNRQQTPEIKSNYFSNARSLRIKVRRLLVQMYIPRSLATPSGTSLLL